MSVPYANQKLNICPALAAESRQSETPTALSPTVGLADDRHVPEVENDYQIEQYDGYEIVHGILPPAVRDGLLERYCEAGRGPCGGTVWWSREVGDV